MELVCQNIFKHSEMLVKTLVLFGLLTMQKLAHCVALIDYFVECC